MNSLIAVDGKTLLESIIQFIRKNYVIVFLFNFLLRLIIKFPIYFYNKKLPVIDGYARTAMTWDVGIPLGLKRQFMFMPLLIQIFSLNFLICPYLTWLLIDILGFSIGLAVIFHLLDKKIEEWEIKKPENFLGLYIFSNLLFPIAYLKWNSTFGLLLMLISFTIYYVFEDRLDYSLIFAILSALTHFLGWCLVSILILYAYKNRLHLIFIIPTFFVLLQFFFFYIRTGDFFLYFHAQQAYWGYSNFPFSYPFNVMVYYRGWLTTNLNTSIMYVSQFWSIAVIISYLYYYIRDKHIDRLNLIIIIYFLFIQILTGSNPRVLNRFSGVILPFCAILLLIRFMSQMSANELNALIAILCIMNVILVWYTIVVDVLRISNPVIIYERLSRYLKKQFFSYRIIIRHNPSY